MRIEQRWLANTLMGVSCAAGVGVGTLLFLDAAIEQSTPHIYGEAEEAPIDLADPRLLAGIALTTSSIMSLTRIE